MRGGSANTEPEADRGPRAGSPRGVVVATGQICVKVFRLRFTRSLLLPVPYLLTHYADPSLEIRLSRFSLFVPAAEHI